MKKLFTFFALCLITFGSFAQGPLTFHNYSAISMAGDTISMSQFYGKKVMVVNVASFCSYTPQYDPLQQLYEDYQQYNFEIIGFPSDDFLSQGGSDSEIISTCQDYGITFLIMDKVRVTGANAAPVYQWLTKASLNGVSNASVSWNFNKFLVDEAGHWVAHYTQSTQPDNQAIKDWIMSPSVISSASSLSADDWIELKSSNPAGSSIDFTVKNPIAQRYNIKIYSGQGQLINTIFDGEAEGGQNINYPVSSLAAGVYLISVQSANAQTTIRYSVVR